MVIVFTLLALRASKHPITSEKVANTKILKQTQIQRNECIDAVLSNEGYDGTATNEDCSHCIDLPYINCSSEINLPSKSAATVGGDAMQDK